jgi:hypothetical protein
MDDNDGARSVRQPVTFYENVPPDELGSARQSRAELEQEMVRRTASRFSTKALRAALFPKHQGEMEQPDGYAHTRGECGDLMTFCVSKMGGFQRSHSRPMAAMRRLLLGRCSQQ